MIHPLLDFSASLGLARNQGKRSSCLAFASSDLNQHINKHFAALSVEYLSHHAVKLINGWKAGDGLNVSSVVSSMAAPGQPEETQYPYQEQDGGLPLTQPPTLTPLFMAACHTRSLNFSQIENTVKDGRAVCLVVAVSDTFYQPTQGIVAYSKNYVPNVFHALLAVGIGKHTTTSEIHILVRNSWGDKWGSNGHAWLPKAYFDTHLFDSFSI